MRPQSNSRGARRGLIIPSHDVELYVLLGWTLTDEPGCSGARMLPPNCFSAQSDSNGVSRETRSRDT